MTWPTPWTVRNAAPERAATADGAAHGFTDVVILHVEKDPLAAIDESAHVIHTGGGVEFHSYLIKGSGVAERGDQFVGLAGGVEVEGDDDGVVFHLSFFMWRS